MGGFVSDFRTGVHFIHEIIARISSIVVMIMCVSMMVLPHRRRASAILIMRARYKVNNAQLKNSSEKIYLRHSNSLETTIFCWSMVRMVLIGIIYIK